MGAIAWERAKPSRRRNLRRGRMPAPISPGPAPREASRNCAGPRAGALPPRPAPALPLPAIALTAGKLREPTRSRRPGIFCREKLTTAKLFSVRPQPRSSYLAGGKGRLLTDRFDVSATHQEHRFVPRAKIVAPWPDKLPVRRDRLVVIQLSAPLCQWHVAIAPPTDRQWVWRRDTQCNVLHRSFDLAPGSRSRLHARCRRAPTLPQSEKLCSGRSDSHSAKSMKLPPD